MTSFSMPDKDKKPSFVKENFEKIASKYDLFNDLNSFFLHRSWKNSLVKILQKESPKEVLDLCCGTGDVAVRIAVLPSIQKLYAVDFSPSMLAVASTRLRSFPKAITDVGDAMELKTFASSSLDAVTISFGLRNVKDLRLCLKEVKRVLKQNGIFLNLDVGKVESPIISFFAKIYFFKIVPLIGYLIWGGKNEMFDYLPVSSLHYPGQKELKLILEEEGFREVYYKNFVFGNAVLHHGRK